MRVRRGDCRVDNVAEDSFKDPTLFWLCSASDLSLVQMIATKVEHETVLRRCGLCVSLASYQQERILRWLLASDDTSSEGPGGE